MVVTRIHDESKPALDFEAGDIRIEYGGPRRTGEFAGSEDRGNERATGMRHRDETHVVIVVRVSGDAVCESRVAWACPLGRAEHAAVALALCDYGSTNDVRCGFRSPGENDADGVAQSDGRALSGLDGRFCSRNEFGNSKRCFHMACRDTITQITNTFTMGAMKSDEPDEKIVAGSSNGFPSWNRRGGCAIKNKEPVPKWRRRGG